MVRVVRLVSVVGVLMMVRVVRDRWLLSKIV